MTETDMQDEYRQVAEQLAATYPNMDFVPCARVPWGDGENSGFMVDREVDDKDQPVLRIGVYADLMYEHDAMLYAYTAEDALALTEILTEQQPEGTDWAAWATHWATEIWPDVAAAIERGEHRGL